MAREQRLDPLGRPWLCLPPHRRRGRARDGLRRDLGPPSRGPQESSRADGENGGNFIQLFHDDPHFVSSTTRAGAWDDGWVSYYIGEHVES